MNYLKLLLFTLFVLMPAFPGTACGPVHEWMTLQEQSLAMISEKVAYDLALGFLKNFQTAAGNNSEGQKTVFILAELEDEYGKDMNCNVKEVMYRELERAFQTFKDYELLPEEKLVSYLKKNKLTRKRLINPFISRKAGKDLGFQRIIWFRIVDYVKNWKKCKDVYPGVNNVYADFRTSRVVARIKVVEPQDQTILWIDEITGERTYQNYFISNDGGASIKEIIEGSDIYNYNQSANRTWQLHDEASHQ